MKHALYANLKQAVCLSVVALGVTAAVGALPEPATGGKAGGPVDLLLLRGHCEMNFGQQPPLDARYFQMLTNRGYRVTVLGESHTREKTREERQAERENPPPPSGEWRPLTLDYLKQFNTVVYLSPSPYLGGGYFDHTGWRSGAHLLQVRRNVEVLQQYVEAGGGLLIVPSMEELCMRTTESLNDLFGRFGMETACAAVRDEAHGFVPAKIIGVFPVLYSWTEALADHPAASGVKRIWYPAYATRWDDNYTTIPLFAKNPAWVPLVRGMPEARAAWLRGTVYDPKANWVEAEHMPADPALFAVRDFGKGRVAICGIGAYHLFYLAYNETGHFAEANFSVVDGIAMEHGNTRREPWAPPPKKGKPADPAPVPDTQPKVPSDLHLLLDNAYRWLAEPAIAAGFGGWDAAKAVPLDDPPTIDPNSLRSGNWTHRDPEHPGRPVRAMKILVGARSAASSGKGSPAAWAAAAKQAGYDVVCFTETLEDVAIPAWPEFVKACADASDAEVLLLPGLDIASDLGDRFLVVGHTLPIRTHVLTADRKKMWWTGIMLLGMGDTLPIVSRPAHHAQVRNGAGALTPPVYTACPGVAVATYKDGRQVDDGLFAWRWQADNASQPIPVAVHEVADPARLAEAAATGLQNRLQANSPQIAAAFFRQGHASFGGNPMSYYLSSGPIVEDARMEGWQTDHWRLAIRARSGSPITRVTISDASGVYRQLAPGRPEAEVAVYGNLGAQKWLVTEVADAAGGRALISQIRNLPPLANIRCMDRQNWFTPLPWTDISYTCGTVTPGGTISVPGVKLADAYCNRLQFVLTSPIYIHENSYDSTWVPGSTNRSGDSRPFWHELPIPEYAGSLRFVSVMRGRKVADRQVVATVTLKQDLVPVGTVWPVIAAAGEPPKKGAASVPLAYVYNDPGTGERVSGTVADGAFVDLPEGGVAGPILALSPLRVNSDGQVGFAAPAGTAKAGTVFRGSYVRIEPAQTDEVRRAYGFDGPTPFRLELTQGKHERTGWHLYLTAADGGVVGRVAGGAVPKIGEVMPVRLRGGNPRWPLGRWDGATVAFFDFFEGEGLGTLNVAADGAFYFGNLLTASHPDLYLAFASAWAPEGASAEVTNPTGAEVTAEVRTPAALAGRQGLSARVTVPAGGTVIAELRPAAP